MQTRIIPASDPEAIPEALKVLRRGGLVAFPTDTVYGLAALPNDSAAIERIFEAKGRDSSKAIAVLVSGVEQLPLLTPGLTDSARQLAERFWPGALTLVVPRHPNLPEVISPYPTIGVRMPNHTFALELLRASGPLATSSANGSGGANTTTAQAVLEQLDGRIDLILDGGVTPGGVPSTVVDCTSAEVKILREGELAGKIRKLVNRE